MLFSAVTVTKLKKTNKVIIRLQCSLWEKKNKIFWYYGTEKLVCEMCSLNLLRLQTKHIFYKIFFLGIRIKGENTVVFYLNILWQ